MGAEALTIEELQRGRRGNKALFFPNEAADAALSVFNAQKPRMDFLIDEFNRDKDPTSLFKALKLLYKAGSVPTEALRNLIAEYVPFYELKAFLKGRISCMKVERLHFLLSTVDIKKLGQELSAKAQSITNKIREVSTSVERFYDSLHQRNGADAGGMSDVASQNIAFLLPAESISFLSAKSYERQISKCLS